MLHSTLLRLYFPTLTTVALAAATMLTVMTTRMVTVDLAVMEAVVEVVEATLVWAIQTIILHTWNT